MRAYQADPCSHLIFLLDPNVLEKGTIGVLDECRWISALYDEQFQLGKGKVLHDDGSQDPKYAELVTQDSKVSEIYKDQKGTLVSAEEWAGMEEELVEELDFDENAFHHFKLIYNPRE